MTTVTLALPQTPRPNPGGLQTTGRRRDADLVQRLSQVVFVFFDFDGVFTDNAVTVDETGRESVRCSRSDGLGLSRLRAAGIGAMIVSTERNPVVGVRAAKLGINCEQAVPDKAEAVQRLAAAQGVPLGACAFVGNDINDIPALSLCGLAIGVADAWPEVWDHLDLVTSRCGGTGAVREVCDVLVYARQAADIQEVSHVN